jgi:hypothetical protein
VFIAFVEDEHPRKKNPNNSDLAFIEDEYPTKKIILNNSDQRQEAL